MAPAQPLVADGEEEKPKIVVKLEGTDEDFNQKKGQSWLATVCESTFEDGGFYGDSGAAADKLEGDALDQEVDVVGLGNCGVADLGKSEDPDSTEQSSSFGNTFSGSEDEVRMSSSHAEVDSHVSAENGEQTVPEGLGRLLKYDV